jgi:hypothetical protein
MPPVIKWQLLPISIPFLIPVTPCHGHSHVSVRRVAVYCGPSTRLPLAPANNQQALLIKAKKPRQFCNERHKIAASAACITETRRCMDTGPVLLRKAVVRWPRGGPAANCSGEKPRTAGHRRLRSGRATCDMMSHTGVSLISSSATPSAELSSSVMHRHGFPCHLDPT